MPEYGNKSYWDERYSAIEAKKYEWYMPFSKLKPHLLPYLKTHANFEILIPGCGSSSLGAELYDDGYQHITNVDSSSVVVNQMLDTYQDKDQMDFTVMDSCDMEFIPNDCFDLIIDKALLDCQLTTDNNFSNVTAYVKEIYRVLKPGGTFFVVSHGQPETRIGFLTQSERGLDRLTWDISQAVVDKVKVAGMEEDEKEKTYYLYICQKL